MKMNMIKKTVLVALCAVSLSNCGRSNSNNNAQQIPPGAVNPNGTPVFQPGWNQWDYQNYFANYYGPGSYFVGSCMTGVWCYQIPQCSYSNVWYGGSCPMVSMGVVQPGYFHMYPQYGIGPSGGSFYFSAAGVF